MKRGDRIELVRMGDDPHPVTPGTRGTVKFVDGLGTIHVQWDNGRSLGVVPGQDEYTPLATNCARCDNLLVGRDDDMSTVHMGEEALCEPCALEEWRGRVLRDAEANGKIIRLTGPNSLLTPGQDEYALVPGPEPHAYLTDEEVTTLTAHPIRRTYRWTHHGQHHAVCLEFRFASAAYIDVLYDGRAIGIIGIWDHRANRPGVRTPADFRRAVDAYWADTNTIRDTIRGGLGRPIGGNS